MKRKQICFIAQFPPPMHGLSKAVETLYSSNLSDNFNFRKVDITNNKKFLKNLIQIWYSNADLFYFTISQTKGGNIRDLIILKLLSLKKKKCLIHLHGGYYRKLVDNVLPNWLRKMNYKAIGKLDGAIVLSDSLKSIFRDMIADEKILVVPNCVDDQFLMSDEEFEEKLKMVEKKDILHFLYLSNFIKSKGYREVLELAKLEKERCEREEKKRFHFDFAGKFFNEEDKDFFFEYIEQYSLKDYVTFHGIVGGEQKKELLKDSDIFILLTKYPNEGQPISILEAMGNGMVVVTTDHAGIPDVVEDGVNGIVVSCSNIDIAYLYKQMRSESEQLTMMAVTNRTEATKKYTETKYIESLGAIFREKLR